MSRELLDFGLIVLHFFQKILHSMFFPNQKAGEDVLFLSSPAVL